MKTIINCMQRLLAFGSGKTKVSTPTFFTAISPSVMKAVTGLVLLLLTGFNVYAQVPCSNTYVKEVYGAGTTEPRIFKDPSSSNYFMTASTATTTYISGLDASGNILWTHTINFTADMGTITDMIVDQTDGTLVAVVRGGNLNYIFKYDYFSASFNWVRSYPNTYIFQNIHEVSAANYVVTGEILTGRMIIFEVNRLTGFMTGYQRDGVVGEFFSTFDGTDIYGACRYYSSGSLFNPSIFRYAAATGTNTWTNTYVLNPPTVTARIYPVAPVVDGGRVMQLSSGDPTPAFNTYLTGPTDAWLLQTNLAGNLLWTNHITIPGYPRLNAKKIINTATGYYLLIDSYNGSIVDYFFVVKTDKSGNLVWANRYGINGLNTVISGVEDGGYLYLTALSGSYTPGSNPLLLKLDPNGMSDANCGYIKNTTVSITAYANTQNIKPTPTNPTAYGNNPAGTTIGASNVGERIYCSTQCLPCKTLTGSLSTGVLAFYPFGNGSLADVSGNGYHLSNPTTAVPSKDRDGNTDCAYFFDRSNGDFLTRTSASFLDNLTTSAFSISLWYQPIGPRGDGDYELLIGRGASGLHCPDTWSEWSAGLYDCRKAVVGFDKYSHWEGPGVGTCSAQLAAITGVWHHLGFVYDGAGTYDLYIDGVLSSTSSGPCGPMSANIGALMLGVDYTGDLDDIVIYNRAITPAEVAALRALKGSCCDGANSTYKTGNSTNEKEELMKGVKEVKGSGAISIYPNPTNGLISISAGKNIIRSVLVYNNTGALAATYHFDKANASVNIDHLSSGMYFIKVITDYGSTIEKVIKN